MELSQSPSSNAPTKLPGSPTVQELRQNNKLWYKLHVFMYDLRTFRSNESCRARLDSVLAPDYIGAPYFSEEEAEQLRETVIEPNTSDTLGHRLNTFFQQKLEKRMKTRMEETGDYRVCAAHDLGPIFERALGVNPTDLAKNKTFVKLVNKKGLEALDKG